MLKNMEYSFFMVKMVQKIKTSIDKCIKCRLEKYYQNLCRKCFCISIEKKVSKEAARILKKEDVILVVDNNSDLSKLNWHFVKLFAEKVPCCIAFDDLDETLDEKCKNKKSVKNKNSKMEDVEIKMEDNGIKIEDVKIVIEGVKIIIPCNMEDELRKFYGALESGSLKSFLESKQSKSMKQSSNINLLCTLSEEECFKYSEARKLKYSMRKENDELMIMINRIESKYPGRKTGMIKTIQELRKVFDNNEG